MLEIVTQNLVTPTELPGKLVAYSDSDEYVWTMSKIASCSMLHLVRVQSVR